MRRSSAAGLGLGLGLGLGSWGRNPVRRSSAGERSELRAELGFGSGFEIRVGAGRLGIH